MKIKIIGLGGVGIPVAERLCQFFHLKPEDIAITFFDADTYEPKNHERQSFDEYGNKAEVQCRRLKTKYPTLAIEAKPVYICEDNIYLYIRDGDIILSCVDNHASRKLVSDYCHDLGNVVFISGGNEYTHGNVQVYVRRDGLELTKPITYLHPEIEHPADKNPAELSCEELAASSGKQLMFTNLFVAAWMLGTFWNVVVEHNVVYSEVMFDMKTGMARSVMR